MAMLPSRITISKMVTPGLTDGSTLPGVGSAGMTLDYRAVQVGDNSQVAMTDDENKKSPLKIRRADDFSDTGNYIVETPQGIKLIYRDSGTKWWYEDEPGAGHQHALGFTKAEALERLAKKYPSINEANDLYSGNYSNDHYNNVPVDENKARGSYVGSKEEGFELRRNMCIAFSKRIFASKSLSAVIVKGNPKHIKDNPSAEKFYNEIKDYLKENGYKVFFDNGKANTSPKKADLWIGHSMGVDRLGYYDKPDIKMLAFGALSGNFDNENIIFVNHPKDEKHLKKYFSDNKSFADIKPVKEHYIFTGEMKKAIDKITNELNKIHKFSYPDYNAYSDPQLYTQVSERNAATPLFDTFNSYYADDIDETSGLTKEQKRFAKKVMSLMGELTGDEEWDNVDPVKVYGFGGGNTPEEVVDFFMADSVQPHHVGGENPEYVETIENDTIETKDEENIKTAFVKTAISYDPHPIIQELIKIPEIRSLIEQQASGLVDSVMVTTPGADVHNTQQKMDVKLEPISGNPFGHMFMQEDADTHQKKPLDKIVRVDRVTDHYGTLSTIIHEILHHKNPSWSESQVENEAQNLANSVKHHIKSANLVFVKASLQELPIIKCDLADTYQKQVIGLQNHSSLDPQSGLLFTYSRPQPLTFWMGKVAFPIDIIFADSDNTIVKIYRNCKPNSQELYSCANASKVIEVVASYCAFHDIDVGDSVFYADDSDKGFTQHIIKKILEAKKTQQKDLDMEDWSIKVTIKKNPDNRRFLRVTWKPLEHKIKKAEILVNPDPILIREALKEMSLGKLVRHALLHILAGEKRELPEDKERELITSKLFKEARFNSLLIKSDK